MYRKINEVIRPIGANSGRSDHKIARRANQVVAGAREKTSQFLNLPEVERVIFTSNATEASQVGFLLDDVYDIVIKIGLHCPPPVHRIISTFPAGTVRPSLGYFSPIEEVEALIRALREI